jgi:hypothetical protein
MQPGSQVREISTEEMVSMKQVPLAREVMTTGYADSVIGLILLQSREQHCHGRHDSSYD